MLSASHSWFDKYSAASFLSIFYDRRLSPTMTAVLVVVMMMMMMICLCETHLFTCNDTVTVCLVGVETCCCQSPLTVVCQCCEPTELCTNGTCALPSATPTQSSAPTQSPTQTRSPSRSAPPTQSASAPPTQSPSAPPACTQLDSTTITCGGTLQGRVITPGAGVTVVAGDLVLTDSTTLVLNVTSTGAPALEVRDGSVVVAGTISVTITEPATVGVFVPLITVSGDGQLDVRENVTLVVTGAGVPQPERQCEIYRHEQRTSSDGASFGVLFTTDSGACESGGKRHGSAWTYEILVPVLTFALCCAACCVVIAGAVAATLFWRRVRVALWAHDGSLAEEREHVVATVVRTSQLK